MKSSVAGRVHSTTQQVPGQNDQSNAYQLKRSVLISLYFLSSSKVMITFLTLYFFYLNISISVITSTWVQLFAFNILYGIVTTLFG